jgi:hypothetical protein
VSRERILAILVAAGFLVAACGGSTPTSAPGQTTSAQTTTAVDTTSGGETTDSTETTETTSGGAGTAEACDLLTVDEVQQATGFTNIEAQPLSDAETEALSVCGFVSNGAFPAATVSILDPENTNTDPAGYLALPGSEEISVSGARAFFVPAAGNLLVVIKGERVAAVQISAQQGEVIDPAKAVAQRIADRL